MEPEIEKKEPGQSAAPFETLQVQDICFQYENNKFGLKNVRLEIKKGEKVMTGKMVIEKNRRKRIWQDDAGKAPAPAL